jgi:hypothetical protein
LHQHRDELEEEGRWIDFPILVEHFYAKFNSFFAEETKSEARATELLNLLIFAMHIIVTPSRKVSC